jgi:predicted N-acetyltransferase YhbS
MSLVVAPQVRRVTAAESAQVATCVGAWLEIDAPLAHTYPQVFGPGARARCFGTFCAGELVSHAALDTVRWRHGGAELALGLVGSVATAPAHRGGGFASELLRHVARLARAEQLDALVLWSDQWFFYERLGFLPVGRQLEALVCGPAGADATGIRAATPADRDAILRLHDAKPTAVARDAAALALLLSAQPMTTLVLERAGSVVAYACLQKGADFAGWWHELGGSDEDVAALLLGATARTRATMVLVPPYRHGLLARLGDAVQLVNDGISALCLPLTDAGIAPVFVDGLDSI